MSITKWRVTWTANGLKHYQDYPNSDKAGEAYRRARALRKNTDVGIECLGDVAIVSPVIDNPDCESRDADGERQPACPECDSVLCPCGGTATYFGEALMGSLKCTSCGDSLMGVGEFFIQTIEERWKNGERGFVEPNPDEDNFLAYCLAKVQHGVPGLTIAEQQRLVEIATGEKIETRKRCGRCDGEGERRRLPGGYPTVEDCPDCNGTGYEVAE